MSAPAPRLVLLLLLAAAVVTPGTAGQPGQRYYQPGLLLVSTPAADGSKPAPLLEGAGGGGSAHRRLLGKDSDEEDSDKKDSDKEDGGECPDKGDVLKLHNKYRDLHGAGDLKWNSSLTEAAQTLADDLAGAQCGGGGGQQLSVPSDLDIGFNTFGLRTSGGSLRNTSCGTAARMWYAEEKAYDWDSDASANWGKLQQVGHFTLMVWDDTKAVGCGQASCGPDSYVVVCGYFPAGNLLLSTVWDDNVKPPGAVSPAGAKDDEDDEDEDDDKDDDKDDDDKDDKDKDDDEDDEDKDDGKDDDDEEDDDGDALTSSGSSKAAKPTTKSQDMRSSQCPDPRDTLDLHNEYRALHGVGKLVWNQSLVKTSQRWSDVLQSEGCKNLYHSKYKGLGENLYTQWVEGGSLRDTDCIKAVKPWYDEIEIFDYDNPQQYWGNEQAFVTIGHFTQMIWKETTDIGCTNAVCGDNAYVVTCQYYPQGNIVGNLDIWNDNVRLPLAQQEERDSSDEDSQTKNI